MGTGELIRKYRKMRGLTQVQLAEKCGLSDPAIRNYELGNRTPSEKHLATIAEALEVAPEALMSVSAGSSREVMHLLFKIASETGMAPVETDSGLVLTFDPSAKSAQKIESAMKAWRRQLDALEAGDISQQSYNYWMASFDSADTAC